MQKVTYYKTKNSVNPNEYVDAETGETLYSKQGEGNMTATVTKDTEYFSIHSDNYVVFDSGAILYLSKILPKGELARVFQMGNMIKGDCSVLFKSENTPHDSETLSLVLELSIDKFYKLVRKLVKKGILSYCVCAPSGYVQKIYMLNPYIARNRRILNCEINSFFKDITLSKHQVDS